MAQTETAEPRFRGLDTWDDQSLLATLWEGQLAAVAAVGPALPALARAASAMVLRLREGGRLIYVGAGTSGLLAVQDGSELPQTFGWPRDRLVLLLAGGSNLESLGAAEDRAEDARARLAALTLDSRDVVLAVAASGTTPYTVAALEQARDQGALTVAMANNADTALLNVAEHPVLLATGAEVVAGSTRMKAGTAQKAALNLLSTLVMTRLGHVFDGRMVDLDIDNDKLRGRGLAMLMDLTGANAKAAAAALAACHDRVKPAVLVVRGLTPGAAAELLDESGGSLRAALAQLD